MTEPRCFLTSEICPSPIVLKFLSYLSVSIIWHPVNTKSFMHYCLVSKSAKSMYTSLQVASFQEIPDKVVTLLDLTGASVAQWVKRWLTDLAERVRFPFEAKFS